MSRKSFRSIGIALPIALFLAGCGGGDSGNNPGPDPSGPFTATVDGAPFAADENLALAQAVPGVPGSYIIQGSRALSGSDILSLQLLVYNVGGPGSYPLGAGPTVTGGMGLVSTPTEGWGTPLSGAAGTLEITTLTPQRMAGSFHYSAEPTVGPASGTRQVTDGEFDLLLGNATDPLPPLPASAGGFLRGTVGGAAFNAATVATSDFGSNFIVTSTNSTHAVSIVLQSVTAAGDYPLTSTPPSRTMTVQDEGSSAQWGPGTGMTGMVTIQSFTADRVIGTFTATLAPLSGTASTIDLSGSFDLGLP